MIATAVPPPIVAPAPPARVLTFADEFRFTASRRTIPAGPLLMQVKNIGEDDHDLRVLGPGGALRAATGVIGPGDLGRIRVRLPRGRYTYFCSVADHAARGMTGTLVVRRAVRRGRR